MIKSLFIALYIVLASYVSLRIGNLRITFASLPVLLAALRFGPVTAGTVGLCGELGNQLLTYGLSYTTPLWLIPSTVRGILLGLVFKIGWTSGRKYYLANILIAIVVTLLNTLIIYIDSVLLGYYTWVYVFGSFVIRIISGIITAIVVGTIGLTIHKRIY